MVLIEIFVIGITLASFPLCGLFLILYLSNYKKNEKKSKNKKAVSPSTDSDEPEVIFSLRPFLSPTNRYAGRPLSLWWNALIGNECKF